MLCTSLDGTLWTGKVSDYTDGNGSGRISLVAKIEQAVAHLEVEPLPLLEADSVAEVGRAGGGLDAGLPDFRCRAESLRTPRAVADANDTESG